MRQVISRLGTALRGWAGLGCILVVIVGAILNSDVFSGPFPVHNWFKLEKDHKAAVDYGYGPGKPIGPPRPNLHLGQVPPIPKSPKSSIEAPARVGAAPAATGTAPVAAGAGAGGFFGPAFPWPIIPLQTALLPDGRVINWGTDEQGNQGAELLYDVWTPSLGNGTNSHTILSNTTPTDIFCAAASLLSQSPDTPGTLLITGGDLTQGGVRNFSNNNVNIFSPANNTLTPAGQMAYARWYPSIVTLSNGDKLILGGQLSPTPAPGVGEPTPELRSAATGWRTLTGISLDQTEWYYPRGFVGPDGGTYLFYQGGEGFRLTPNGTGTQQDLGHLADVGDNTFSSTLFFNPTGNPLFPNGNPFTVMLLRFPSANGFSGSGNEVEVADISSYPPVVNVIGNLSYVRYTGNLTLLADGTILASGGSSTYNDLPSAIYQVELYNPKTGTWTLGASAANPRLYHSSTLLLPDGSVLTGGGGAPGPVNELNAEIYYPPYLYLQDGSGNPAPRPTIFSSPSTINLNQNFMLTVGANDTIGSMNLIRVGSNTHDFNSEQRLIPVSFAQSGTQITATVNASPEIAPPGYYMVFVINSSGVPAVAPIVFVPLAAQSLPDLIPTSLSYNSTTGIFTSVVNNQGAGPTPSGVVIGNGFYVDGNFASWGNVPGPLAAGASVTITSSGGGAYTIPSGTHTIMVKTNDYGTTGRFVESDPSNNTLSQSITIGGSAPTASLTASPTTIAAGSSSTLTWSSTNATSCSGTGFTASGTSGSTSVSPTATKTYTLTCSGRGGQATASATVTVTTTAAPTASLSAAPTSIVSGSSSTLTWSSTNATSCSGTGFTASGTSGSTSVSPTATTTYTLTCSGPGGQATASATVTVSTTALPDLDAISLSYSSTTGLFTSVVKNIGAGPTPSGVVIGNGFYVDGNFVSWGSVPGPLAPGASVTINSSGGGAYTIPSGTHTIKVIADDFGCCGRIQESDKPTTTASDPNNTLSQSITIGGSAPTASLSAAPTSIVSGSSSTLTWSSTNATSCSGTGFTASGTSGSTSVSPTATTTYTLTCSGPGGQATASATVTVSTTALPNLDAISLSYNSTTGLFTSVVQNIGAGPTPNGIVIGNGFYVDGNFVSWGAVPGPLAAGASVTITSSGGGAYTIPSGTHTIKVIADDFGCCGRIQESDKPTTTASDPNNTLSQPYP